MKTNESKSKAEIEIVNWDPKYAKAFYDLNARWIRHYFKMEETDHKSLENPQSYIIDRGGDILIALLDHKPVGVCALIKMDHPRYDFELAKMGVAPAAQGFGIGYKLGVAVLDRAKELGGRTVYLESNTVLTPAMKLYDKLGFEVLEGEPTPYERCNIQMKVKV